MIQRFLLAAGFVLSLVIAANAEEYRVEKITEPPPEDMISKELGSEIAATGFRVIRGSSRTVCEIWPCKSWTVKPDFTPSLGVLYPFEPGQLIGVLRFTRRGSDFRDQTLDRGVYTLRYALQPQDGNHVGTSPTRDFLLLVRAGDDPAPAARDIEELAQDSAAAAESSHPAMLCLQRVEDSAGNEPAMRHDESNDWWLLHFSGKGSSNGKQLDVPVDLIVAGHAHE